MIFGFNGFSNITYIYDENRNVIGRLYGNASIFSCYALNLDKKLIATQNNFYEDIYIWDITTGLPKYNLNCLDEIITMDFSKNGEILLSGTSNGIVRVWDINNKINIKNLNINGKIHFISYIPNGKYILIGKDFEILMLDIDYNFIRSFFVGEKRIYTIYYSPDNRYFASSSWEYNIKIWEIETGKCVQEYFDEYQFISVKFSNGKYIATKHINDMVKVWHIDRSEYVLSIHENKFYKTIKLDWIIKKIKIGKESKKVIEESLYFFPDDVIEKILNYLKYRECLIINNKVVFIDN